MRQRHVKILDQKDFSTVISYMSRSHLFLSSIPDRIKVEIDLNPRFLGESAGLNPAELHRH